MHPDLLKKKIENKQDKTPITDIGDRRYKILETSMKRLLYKQDALIEVLHGAQGLFGYLDDNLLRFVANNLKLPLSKVYGVATFYHFFTLKPRGKHTCVVCMGTACYVKGANIILEALEEQAGIKAGETTADEKVSILTARCIGACGIAPAIVYDGVVAGKQTPESAVEKLNKWLKDDSTGTN
ncbi:MAG: bidirectional hydrogenase complex protein HoxE [Verrucomicrobiia bacterium]